MKLGKSKNNQTEAVQRFVRPANRIRMHDGLPKLTRLEKRRFTCSWKLDFATLTFSIIDGRNLFPGPRTVCTRLICSRVDPPRSRRQACLTIKHLRPVFKIPLGGCVQNETTEGKQDVFRRIPRGFKII